MLPGNGIGDTDKTCYPGSPEYKFKYGSEGLNTNEIKEYIRKPHKFNTKPEMDGKYYNLWSADNERTDGNDDVVIKSVYDPSPVGYSLPASNAFTGFSSTGGLVGEWNVPLIPVQINAKFPFDKGWYFYTKPGKTGHTFFFQAVSMRDNVSGFMLSTNTVGFYLLAGPQAENTGRTLFFAESIINPENYGPRSYGFAVRSAEERETHKFNIKLEMDGKYYNLWSTDNDKTDANDEVVIKSVYDPSPVGYSLPASNAFTGFTTTGGHTNNPAEYNVNGGFDNGWYFYTKPNKQGNIFWFPSCGYRYCGAGSLGHVTINSWYWVSGPGNRVNGRYLGFASGGIYPLNYTNRSYGYPVRSAEEKNPHKFNIKLEMDGVYVNLWSTDNERTDANDDVVIKSVYDPSPVGYSLPASNAFTGFTTTGGTVNNQSDLFNVKGEFDKGWYFYTKPNKKGNTLFFQALGWRYDITGSLDYMTLDGLYWVAGPSGRKNGRYLHFSSGYVYPLDNTNRAFGFPVRSAEEKEENVTIFQHLRFVFYYIQKRTSYLSYLLYINYFVCYPVLFYGPLSVTLISSTPSLRWTEYIITCGVRIMIRLCLMMRW